MELLTLAIQWLLQYGGVILFLLLALGIVGLPIPDESLMLLAGFLVAQGKLAMASTFAFALTGSIFGITLSYLLGYYAGPWVLQKYGKKFKITEARVEKAHHWFGKIGKWTLFIGYFFPVIRHLTGLIAGSTRLGVSKFMLFAYTGALVWCLTFLSLGYFLRTELALIWSKGKNIKQIEEILPCNRDLKE
jgi:membrane protein DedA with SNARE-associated domain